MATHMAVVDEFHNERIHIASLYNCPQHKIFIEEHQTVGEVCFYIDGQWIGYIDNDFYESMG